MLKPVNIENLKKGDGVVVKSTHWKIHAWGVVINIGVDNTCVKVRINGDYKTPGCKELERGFENWYGASELFVFVPEKSR